MSKGSATVASIAAPSVMMRAALGAVSFRASKLLKQATAYSTTDNGWFAPVEPSVMM